MTLGSSAPSEGVRVSSHPGPFSCLQSRNNETATTKGTVMIVTATPNTINAPGAGFEALNMVRYAMSDGQAFTDADRQWVVTYLIRHQYAPAAAYDLVGRYVRQTEDQRVVNRRREGRLARMGL